MSSPSKKSDPYAQEPPDESNSSNSQHKSSDGSSSAPESALPQPRPRKRPVNRRNGTESGSSRKSWRWSTWSLKQQRRRSSAALSTLFQHRRRTFPPAARVLKDEKRRFTHGSSKKKSVKIKRRHSLAGILSSLKTTHRQSQPSNLYPSVRSSMVLHISDEDAAASNIPEVLYDDYISTESMISTMSSSCQYCNNNNNNSSNNSSGCPRHHRHRQQPPSSASSGSRPGRLNEGGWFYSWVQHHPRRKKNKQRLRKNSSSGNDSTDIKKNMFVRPPTISDLSSLSNPLSKLDSIINHYPHRFSAFWYDTYGRSGKQQVHIDDKGAVARIRKDNDRCHCSATAVQSSMLLFGFLCFPLWWVGAWMYLRHPTRTSPHDPENQSLSFASPRILGLLNCWMSCFSIIIVPVIVGLGVWYHYSVP
ncbi:hypothetical protein BJV82DRAFT_266683 [Fennellomyces sp. T-0311]|nr:hypothetical protein BJV82DRAFT_266683 [Fennellomyces sp. T-0311]